MMQILKLIIFGLCCFFSGLDALARNPEACLKELQLNFFRPDLVTQALSLYRIPEGLWTPIATDLSNRSTAIPRTMKMMTRRMVPNPLSFPMDRMAAAKILKEALFQVFTEVMRHYYITERPTLDYIFDYILSQEVDRMVECFGEEVRDLLPEFE